MPMQSLARWSLMLKQAVIMLRWLCAAARPEYIGLKIVRIWHGWSFVMCEDFGGKLGLQSSCLGAVDAYTCCPLAEACKRCVAGSV